MIFKIIEYLKKEKVSIIFCIIMAAIIEVLFFHESLLIGNGEIEIVSETQNNYEKIDDFYISKTSDGQFYYETGGKEINYIEVDLDLINVKAVPVQVFYSKDGIFSESKSIIKISNGSSKFVLPYPCQYIRIDISNKENIMFKIKNVNLFSSVNNLIIFKIILLFIICIYFIKIIEVIIQKMEKILKEWEKLIDIYFIIGAFCLYLFFAWNILLEYAPDEAMRYDISLFIFNHGKLPLGYEKEILNPVWGFSYAFVPYLPSLLAVIPMKLCSLFTTDPLYLLKSARIINVFAGTFTVFMVLQIGNQLFSKKFYKYLFVLLTGFLPQFIFLSSYLNNDVFAVLSTSIIIYAWITGEKNNYTWKTCAILGIGIGICALSYYNAYSFILCSIILFIFWLRRNLKNQVNIKFLLKKAGIVVFIAFGIAGWFFIRNAIAYNGDFLGLKTIKEYGELYAIEKYKPSYRATPANLNISIFQMLFQTYNGGYWILSVIMSFFGVFGPMSIFLNNGFYITYSLLITIGVIGNVLKRFFIKNTRLNFCFWICIIFTVGLNIYNSYFSDYQPQGRYCMPMLLPIMIIFIEGIDYFKGILEKYRKKEIIKIIDASILTLLIYLITLGIQGMNVMIAR